MIEWVWFVVAVAAYVVGRKDGTKAEKEAEGRRAIQRQMDSLQGRLPW